jgi:L,D-transpeptidase ErfK/SrfK
MRSFIRVVGAVVATVVLLSTGLYARDWSEESFDKKPTAGRPYLAVAGRDPSKASTVIGSVRFYQVQSKDTFLDIARYYSLGYNELEQANPGVDPWIPPVGQAILLPTEWVLPDADYQGIVINIPEMRLYYFHGGGDTAVVTTYPVGLGRDDWKTPQGKFRITEKNVNPRWVLPESIKIEHRKDGRPAPDFIEGGAPDNPLGKYRFRLSLPLYGIHGTDIPWGVGMQVSHGCVRLYPEEIDRLFPMVPVGTPGEFVYQPVKVGVRDGRVYIEVSQDIYDMLPGMHREAWRLIDKLGLRQLVDPERVKRAVLEQSGVPMEITRESNAEEDEVFSRKPPGDSRAEPDADPERP